MLSSCRQAKYPNQTLTKARVHPPAPTRFFRADAKGATGSFVGAGFERKDHVGFDDSVVNRDEAAAVH